MERTSTTGLRGVAFGLSAAILFGVSAPLAKRLVPEVGPLMLAALLYLGAGVALTAAGLFRGAQASSESPLRRADLPWLFGIIALGGIAGPALMLVGLELVSGVAASLLLNLEAPFTVLIAVTLFREHLGRKGLLAVALTFGGAVALASWPGNSRVELIGVLALVFACASWAFDNNFTQRLSLRNPLTVVRVKRWARACARSRWR